ncbi:MAG: hypothetical protein PVI59_02530 [Anaerolineae bacterium]
MLSRLKNRRFLFGLAVALSGIAVFLLCVFIDPADGGIEAGWAWNWPGVQFNVVAYPNIMYGKNPWLASTSPQLPRRVGDIGCLEADFEVVQQGRGKGNLAFDLWITDSASSQPPDITREIMIWLSREWFRPAGSRVDTVTVAGDEIRLWRKEDHSPSDDGEWTFLAFVYQSDKTSGPIDLDAFLSFLVDNGYIASDEYLAGMQLGNEIVSGYGQTLVREYEIRFCDE